MTTHDLDAANAATAIAYDLARIEMLPRHPSLDPDSDAGDLDAWQAALDALVEERMLAFEERLEFEREEPELAGTRFLADPEQVALDQIAAVTAAIALLQKRLTYLVAYTREFTPDPPRLVDIAEAAGVSRTQITRMYGQAQVDQIATILGLPSPRAAREALRQRNDVPTTRRD